MGEIRNKDGLTEEEFLKQYKPSKYERPSVTVDMLILCMSRYLDNLKVLLIQRKNHPYINCWALAGGFVGIHESTYDAACRELQEETGLVTLMREQPVLAGDDAKKALWFDISLHDDILELKNEEENINIKYCLHKKIFKNGVVDTTGYTQESITDEKLAFDHNEIILEGLLRLKNKILYSDIAFNLLPEEFTLPDVKRVYEVILGKELYKSNFNANIKSKLISTDCKITSMIKGGKKAAGYKYKGQ